MGSREATVESLAKSGQKPEGSRITAARRTETAAMFGKGNAFLDIRQRCRSTRRVRNCHEAARIVH